MASVALWSDRPNTTEPICYDAEGTATLLPVTLRKVELRGSGAAEEAITHEIAEGYRTGQFHPAARTGIAYMLATEQTVFDPGLGQVIPYVPHLMFDAPYGRAHDLGMAADHAGHGLPFLIFEGEPNAMVIVPLAR